MSKALTVELIHMKTKTNRIDSIKSLNLWGNDLDDIAIVSQMPSLEVLSLSVNHITTLRDIQSCYNLVELHMRKNQINNLNEVRYLQNLRKLKTLVLSENPIADHPLYRAFIVKCLPQIEKLDNANVSAEDKQKAAGVDIDDIDEGSFQPPPQKISPPRREPQQPKKQWNIKESVQDDFDSSDNNLYGGGGAARAGGKLQRSPPRKIESPQNQSPQREEQIPSYGKIKRSPPRKYENPNSTNFNPPQYNPKGRNEFEDDNFEQKIHQQNAYQQPRSQPSQYENQQQMYVGQGMGGRAGGGGYPQYQRAQTAKVVNDDYDRDDDVIPGTQQTHQVKQKKEGTREKFRNENILCAIIALMKELDKSGLEFVRKDAEKRLAKLE